MKTKILTLFVIIVSIFLFSGCQKEKTITSKESQAPVSQVLEEKNQPAETVESGNKNKADYSGWETYSNEKYKYQIKYPKGWFFMKDYCCPPPPASVNLNNISDKKAEYAARQTEPGAQGINIDCLYEGKIDDIGEVQLQKKEGKSFEMKKINNFDAIIFNQDRGPGQPMPVFTYYIVDGKQGCRVIYDGGCESCQDMVNSFIFQ